MTTITTICECGEKEKTIVVGSSEPNFQAEMTCAGCVEGNNRQDVVDAWENKETRRSCSR